MSIHEPERYLCLNEDGKAVTVLIFKRAEEGKSDLIVTERGEVAEWIDDQQLRIIATGAVLHLRLAKH